MSKYTSLFSQVATWLIGFLILIGLLILVVIIPVNSQGLESTYEEFKGDSLTIQALTSLVTMCCIVALAAIARLLNRIRFGGLHSTAAQRWVDVLAGSSFALGGSFALLFAWLSSQNAVSPFAAIGLLTGIAIAATVGFITLTLKSVLQEATAAQQELEGVI
jgi:hypothetical protein